MNTRQVIITLACCGCAFILAWPGPATAEEAGAEAQREAQAMLEDAERARVQAEQARAEASRVAKQAREIARLEAAAARQETAAARQEAARQASRARAEQQEMERVRDELSRAHRELREASREIASAHRALARKEGQLRVVRQLNLGDRAVIGVILGSESTEGVQIIGVSPNGPAERAGLQAGDTVVSIRGESLGRDNGARGREILFSIMDDVESGETIALEVARDGELLDFEVTAERREPSSWQTMIRIPELADSPEVVIEDIEIPEIDEAALNERIRELNEELKVHKLVHVSPSGEDVEIEEHFLLPETFDVEIDEFSELAGDALREADIWFGLRATRGLRLARINPALGAYFATDRGILVLEARNDNAYLLESGDVILEVDGRPVNDPTDLLRALREIEPGSQIEMAIKRHGDDQTLSVTMPENRLGHSPASQLHHGEPR